MPVEFDQVEDAIIERIKTEVPSFNTVKTYAGELEGEIEKLPLRFPAALVFYRGSDHEWVDGPSHEEKATFGIVVAAKDLRGGASSREGAYELVKLARRALTNQKLGLNIERLHPRKTELLFTNKTITVYGIEFITSFDEVFDW